jgi:hypothetical protein
LKYHQNHAKYCISKRSDTIPEYLCEYCEKTLGSKYILNTHLGICPIKKKQEYDTKRKSLKLSYKCKLTKLEKKYESKLSESKTKIKALEEENSKLKEQLHKQQGIVKGIQTAPEKKTIYNTAIHPKLVNLPINNIRALTDEFVIEQVNNGVLTYEKAACGYPIGMLDVICELITHENNEGVIERNYVCTDVSRNSFHRLLESKKWKSDKGGRYLNSMLDTFRSAMEEHKNTVYDTYQNTPHESFKWEQVEWERKNISRLYSGIVCKEGTGDREELVNILRKEISKRASV